jgi:hypothetical protein
MCSKWTTKDGGAGAGGPMGPPKKDDGHQLFCSKAFCGVFSPTSPRNTKKYDETEKKRGENDMRYFVIFLGKKFLTW